MANNKRAARWQIWRRILLACFLALFGCFDFSSLGLDGASLAVVSARQSEDAQEQALTGDQIVAQQQILAQQFSQLEQKLFDLYQLERDSRPARANLLRQMYEWSQSRDMKGRLEQIVGQVQQGQLRLAQQAQQETLDDLKSLMEILQKEDQSQRLEEEKKRMQEYLREVKRLLQMQSALQQNAQLTDDPGSLELQQQRIGDQTGKLDDRVQGQPDPSAENERSTSGESADPESAGDRANSSDLGKGNNSESESGQQGSDSKDPSGDEKAADPDGPTEGNPDQERNGQGGDEQSGSEETPASSQGQSGSEGEGKPGSGDGNSGGEGTPGASQESQPTDKLSQQLKQAQQRMRAAEEALRKAEREEATEEMQRAIDELKEAQEALEKILRQAREEEMMSTLARLEDQFRQMLESQLRINQKTLQLDEVPADVRGPDHEIGAARLAGDQRKNSMAAVRAAMLLREDATSVALAISVEQLNDDMTSVADSLVQGDTGSFPQQLETDIVETLELLIESVVQAQDDLQQKQQQAQAGEGQGGEPGEMPLVDQIAELKMLKGLQLRILNRHRQIATQFQAADKPLGRLQDQNAQKRLQKLEQQQEQLFHITREMVKQIQ